MNKKETCNGWTNWETFHFALNHGDDLYHLVQDLEPGEDTHDISATLGNYLDGLLDGVSSSGFWVEDIVDVYMSKLDIDEIVSYLTEKQKK
tara:strand:+ start:2272 stop:2544 length:273 start_codon:yes stop_codon:yes gene_type:complete